MTECNAANWVTQVTDHGVLVMELGSGLHFPAVEHFTDVLRAHAIHGDTHTHIHSTMHANTVLDKDP